MKLGALPFSPGALGVPITVRAARWAKPSVTLAAVVDDIETVPEAFREAYTEKDGKFYLDVGDDVNGLPKVVALKSAHDRQKAENAKFKAVITALTGRGLVKKAADGSYTIEVPEDFTAEEWNRLKDVVAADDDANLTPEERQKRKDAAKRATDQYEQRIKALEAKHNGELASRDEEIKKLRGQVEKLIVDTALDQAMDAAAIDPKFRKSVRAMHRGDVKVVEGTDGELKAVIETDLDPETPLGKYVETWAQSDEGRVYVGQARGGGGEGDRTPPGTKGTNPWNPKTLNRTLQGQILKADPAKAKRMAAEHGQSIPDAA